VIYDTSISLGSVLHLQLKIIDKNSLLGEASIRKGGVGGKNKIPQNMGSFMRSALDKREIHWGGRSKQGLSPSGISVLPAEREGDVVDKRK
jgi:hypothetical protein